MQDIAFSLTPAMRSRLAIIPQREADGSLTPLPDMQLPPDPEVQIGGYALSAPIGKSMKYRRLDRPRPKWNCADDRATDCR
jgi:methyl acetate hydrolase